MIDIIGGDDFTTEDSITRVIRAVLEIDRLVYGVLDPADNGDENFWRERWRHRPDAHHVCFVNGFVAGYLQAVPLFPWTSHLVKSGQLRDAQILDSHVPLVSQREDQSLYIMSVVLHPAFQGLGLAHKMWNATASYWNKLSELQECLLTIWSEHGGKFFRPFFGARVGVDAKGHQIFSLNLDHNKLPVFSGAKTNGSFAVGMRSA